MAAIYFCALQIKNKKLWCWLWAVRLLLYLYTVQTLCEAWGCISDLLLAMRMLSPAIVFLTLANLTHTTNSALPTLPNSPSPQSLSFFNHCFNLSSQLRDSKTAWSCRLHSESQTVEMERHTSHRDKLLSSPEAFEVLHFRMCCAED